MTEGAQSCRSRQSASWVIHADSVSTRRHIPPNHADRPWNGSQKMIGGQWRQKQYAYVRGVYPS